VKFPVTIRHRTSKAKIYAPGGKFAYYRLAYSTAGKRRMQTFANYSDAKTAAERIVRELANGSQAAALNASQSRDAIAAFERLQGFYQASGRRVSLLAAVSEFVEASGKLHGRTLDEAVTGYLRTVVSVKRKDVTEAVEQFLGERKHKAEAKDGKRSQLSASYETHVAGWLRGFASTFPSTAVCDLTKEHINLYFKPLSEMSAKNRNDRRATVRMFLAWAVRQDYLSVNHRLFEASGMTRETVETADTDFFRPGELKKLLDNAPADLRPVLAIAGLLVCAAKRSCVWIGRMCGASRDILKSPRDRPKRGSVALWKSAPRSPLGSNPAAKRRARCIRLVSMFSSADLWNCATA
jgi:hypothetical protein